jgi:crotonobetainyl-CoA:carnitine CoA-transferase CaiB-like acyl-CoA transferase
MVPLLKNISVLEIGAVVMGPFAGQILADLGAKVIKIETIEGDIARASFPQGAGMGALFVNNNRNKRTISIDLKDSRGKAILHRLMAQSDVLLHNMRTDAAKRLGIDFDSAKVHNPGIIHCSAIGFGQGGRYRDRPAFDDIIQAASGFAAFTGGEPHFVPTIVADKIAALYTVYGILAALVARRSGTEQAIQIEVPMFEALASFILNEHLAAATFEDQGSVGYPRLQSAHRRPHRTRDGWIAALPYTGRQWQRFLAEVGQEAICAEPWFQDETARQSRIDDLYALLSEALLARTTAEWLQTLSRLDIPCSQVNRIEDLLTDPHLADLDFFRTPPGYPDAIKRMLPQPIRFDGLAAERDLPAPPLGADSLSVLHDLGYAPGEIDALVDAAIVYTPPRSEQDAA